MKRIEKMKLILGLVLISFAISGGLIFFLESFKIFDHLLDYNYISTIYRGGWISSGGDIRMQNYQNSTSGGGASNVPIFLGLCGLSGTFLLTSITKKN